MTIKRKLDKLHLQILARKMHNILVGRDRTRKLALIADVAKALGAKDIGDNEFKFTAHGEEEMKVFIRLVDSTPGLFPCEDWMLRSVLVVPTDFPKEAA